MELRKVTCITAMTLFTALAMPIGTAAQDNPSQDHKPKHHTYKLIEIGTFGGPSSSVAGPGVKLVNDRGTGIGGADTPTSDSPDCFFGDCFIQHGFTWQNGVITDVGALPGVNSSFPNEINDRGVIVGVSENGLIDPLVGGPEINAVVWKDGQIVNLGTLGGNQSFGFSINNRDQAVGVALNAIPDPFSLFGLGTQTRAFLWQHGVMQDLGTLPGDTMSMAYAINFFGQVIGTSGSSTMEPEFNGTQYNGVEYGGVMSLEVVGHPFLWTQRDGMKDLNTLIPSTSGWVLNTATGINAWGQIVGSGVHNGETHGFLLTPRL